MILSGRHFLNRNRKLRVEEIIAIQDILLEYILSNEWKDHNNFARTISEKILRAKPVNKSSLEKTLRRFSHPFFSFNKVSKKEFIERFPTDAVIHRMINIPKPLEQEIILISTEQKRIKKSKVTFEEIFPEVKQVDIETARFLVKSLDLKERVIQDALREALREKGATNMVERKSDSSLEIADIEDFTLGIKGKSVSFSSVVKGYRSVSTAKISFEDIAHQVLKAYDTHPDHIILILAKPVTDGLITRLVKYGIDCGNRNLVILVDQVNLARFLGARGVI